MIVMVIIMMLSNLLFDSEFLSGLASGCFSGIIVTILLWYISTRLLTPRIKISKDIAYEIVPEEGITKDKDGAICVDEYGNPIKSRYNAYVYRIKLENETTRNAFDIRVYFRLCYDNHYSTIELPYLPYLQGQKNLIKRIFNKLKNKEKSYEHHRTLPFRMTNIRLSKIEGYNIPTLKQKHANGDLNLKDFRKDDTIIEFVIMAFDSFTGSPRRVVSNRYTQKELDEYLKEGEFLDGQMHVNAKKKTADG